MKETLTYDHTRANHTHSRSLFRAGRGLCLKYDLVVMYISSARKRDGREMGKLNSMGMSECTGKETNSGI